jgi:lycopene cyclase domain-containing protein
MSTLLTYADFHLLFVLPPIALLALVLGFADRIARPREAVAGVALLTAIATVYTTPWDNYLIAQGVWTYAEGAVLARLGRAPIEEYAFFVLQPVLAGLWFLWLGYAPESECAVGVRARLLGAGVWLGVAAGGAWLLGVPGGLYLGAIAVWAAPIAALQWALGGPVLWRNRRLLALSIAVPTLYLSLIDRIAIGLGIWQLSSAHTTGLDLLGLPVEEGVFFLVTTTLVVQGLILFHWVLARVRAGGRTYGLAGLVPIGWARDATPPATPDSSAEQPGSGPEETSDRAEPNRSGRGEA